MSDAARPDIHAEYTRRLAERRARWQARDRVHLLLSQARLAIAGVALAIPIFLGWRAATWVLLPAAVFVVIAILHDRALGARARAQAAVDFYARGLARLEDRWAGTGDPGDTYRPAAHLYADDLDLFGRGSLFELLATARTHGGLETLADWLLSPADPDIARARQDAIRELAGRIDLREALAVAGDGLPRAAVDAPALRTWAASPPLVRSVWPRVVLAAGTTFVAGTIIWAYAVQSLPVAWGRAALGVFTLLAAWVVYMRPGVERAVHTVEMPARDLDLFATLLAVIERETFTSARLKGIQRALTRTGRPASAEIARLSRLIALLASRTNIMVAVPAALVFWATQMALAIDAWRLRLTSDVPTWLTLVGEFDALVALGGYAAEHADHAFPTFETGAPRLSATGLAHPLLPRAAVANDISIGDPAPRLLVVSGSNMSGKSTFLRALGLNLVLAQMGAPVRATRLVMTPLAIGASIRIVDSLADGRSRFFAEITRLKSVVSRVTEARGQVVFLLDEILSGTNSHDRRLGAEAVLNGLVERGAIGLVTTHDLALASIAESLGARAANVHFEDRLHGEALHFDYRLRPGVVQTSNAIPLMRAVGLIDGLDEEAPS